MRVRVIEGLNFQFIYTEGYNGGLDLRKGIIPDWILVDCKYLAALCWRHLKKKLLVY